MEPYLPLLLGPGIGQGFGEAGDRKIYHLLLSQKKSARNRFFQRPARRYANLVARFAWQTAFPLSGLRFSYIAAKHCFYGSRAVPCVHWLQPDMLETSNRNFEEVRNDLL
jgi:hypothetical protein